MKTLKGADKAPTKLVIGLSDGSIGQLTKPFPAGASSIKDLWEKETGIQLEIVGLPNGQEFTKTMQDISTKGGAYDIYSVERNRLGDLAESGGIAKLDDCVAEYKPEWVDPVRGYVDGAKGVALLNQYRGSTYGVSLDGDFQTWVYRTDLFGDAGEQKAFKDKYGYDLAPPRTWKQQADVAAFFQRPDKGLFGCTDLRNQGWGYTNWYQRYTSTASPDQYLFADDASPLINSDNGIAATARPFKRSSACRSSGLSPWLPRRLHWAQGRVRPIAPQRTFSMMTEVRKAAQLYEITPVSPPQCRGGNTVPPVAGR